MEGEAVLSQPSCLQAAHPGSLSYILSVFAALGACSLSSVRVVTEQKWHSPLCSSLSFSISLISVGICLASNMIIAIT